jgi:HSP20 family protein
MTRFQFPVRNLPLPIQEIATEMENLVDRVFTKGNCGDKCGPDGHFAFAPHMDVSESDTQYQVILDLPGVKIDAVKIEVHEDRLTISGSRPLPQKVDGVEFHREERSFGEFRRTLVLPKLVDTDRVDAQYAEGVLTVTIPKIPKAQPKKIEIRAGAQ